MDRPIPLQYREGKLSPAQSLPLALQHLIAMFIGCISPSALVAAMAGLPHAETVMLIQSGLVVSGIATLLQVYPLFGRVGSGLPIVFGVSYAFVPIMLSVVRDYGIAALVGGQLVGSLVALIVGWNIRKLRRLFPPVVTGTVVTTIGITLYPIAAENMAGGVGSATYGSVENWILALVTLVVSLLLSFFAKGFWKKAYVLLGILVGYGLAAAAGMIDYSHIEPVQPLVVPGILPFGIEFQPSAIATMVVMYVISCVQTVGEASATASGAMGRMPSCKELSGSVMGGAAGGLLGVLLGAVPVSPMERNMGLVVTNRVTNRIVFAQTAIFIILAGLFPVVGTALSTIPKSVLGGATVAVFGSITMSGVKLIVKDGIPARVTAIAGISIALCAGIVAAPESLGGFPEGVRLLLTGSPVALSALCAIILNQILPQRLQEDTVHTMTEDLRRRGQEHHIWTDQSARKAVYDPHARPDNKRTHKKEKGRPS